MESSSRQSGVRSNQRGKMSVHRMAVTYGHRFARRMFLTNFHGKEVDSILEVEESLVSDALCLVGFTSSAAIVFQAATAAGAVRAAGRAAAAGRPTGRRWSRS